MDSPKYKRDKRSPVPKNSTVSKIMSNIKGKNTKPETLLRKLLFKNEIRGYRINHKGLPGKPDITFTKKKVAIFVNGCYWHGCTECGWKAPKHNTTYWVTKIEKNRHRDIIKRKSLETLGYNVITVWEHEIKKDIHLALKRIIQALY
jgi:DNA mismatch endonuclease Vsr